MRPFIPPDFNKESDLRGYAWQLCCFGELIRLGVAPEHVVSTGAESTGVVDFARNWTGEAGEFARQLRGYPDGEVRLFFNWERPAGVSSAWLFDCKSGQNLSAYEDLRWALGVEERFGLPVRLLVPAHDAVCRRVFVVDPALALPLVNNKGIYHCQPHSQSLAHRKACRELGEVLRLDHGLYPEVMTEFSPTWWCAFAEDLAWRSRIDYPAVLAKLGADPWAPFLKSGPSPLAEMTIG